MATFRVFISSSFLDFQNERNALHEKVFKKLEELCAQHNSYFQAVDLRWGISEEEAKAYNTLDICINEVKRTARITPKPNFLILVGDRYGWRPLPPQINEKTFKKLIKAAGGNDKNLIESTWIKDSNSIASVYVLKDKLEASENETDIRKALDRTMSKVSLNEDEIIELSASATHREILARKKLPEFESGNVHCVIRNLNHVPSELQHEFYDMDDNGQIDPRTGTMCTNLKNTLKKSFPDAFTYTADITESGEFMDGGLLDSFCDEVYNMLEKSIMEELDKLKENPMADEVQYHKSFAKKCHENFYLGSRSKMKLPEFSRFRRIWKEDVVLVGQAGTGMSMMMSELYYRISRRSRKSRVVIRFIGESGNSTDINNLLRGILEEVGIENAASISNPQFYIEKNPFKSPVIILLDGVEKAKNPKWLIRYFMDNEDKNLRLYLSMTSDFYNLFPEKVKRKYRLVQLPPIDSGDVKHIVKHRLSLDGRKLTKMQTSSVVNAFDKRKDLKYLNYLMQDATGWKSCETPQISQFSYEDSLRKYFLDLEEKMKTNRMLRLYTIRFLLVSREGLSEDELLELLGRQEEVVEELKKHSFHEFNEGKVPFMYLSRFLETLRPFLKESLSEGKVVLRFADSSAHTRASEYAWADDENNRNKQITESRLAIASYFETKLDTILVTMLKAMYNSLVESVLDYRFYLNSRIALEYPWQLLMAEEYERLYQFISNRKYFTLICDRNLADVLTYWTAVEQNTSYSIRDTFSDIFTKAADSEEIGDTFDNLIIRPLLDLLAAHGGFSQEISLLNNINNSTTGKPESSEYVQGQSLIDINKYEKAMEVSEKMQAQSPEGSIQNFDALYVKAQALYRQEKYQEALDIFIELESLGKKLEEKSRIFTALKWQASCYKAMAMQDEAMDIYMRLEDYVDEDSDVGDAIVVLFEAATGIAMFKDLYEGADRLTAAMKLAEKLGNKTWLVSIYEHAIRLFAMTEDRPEETEEVFKKYVALKLEDDPNFDIPSDILTNYLYAVQKLLPDESEFSIELYNLMKKVGGIREELRQDNTPHDRLISKTYDYILDNLLLGLSKYIENRAGNVEYFKEVINKVIAKRFKDYAEGTNENYQNLLESIRNQDSGKELSDDDLRILNFTLMGIAMTAGYDDFLIDSLIDESKDNAKMAMVAYINNWVDRKDYWRSKISYGAYRMRLDNTLKIDKMLSEINAELEKMLEGENELFKSVYNNVLQQKKEHKAKK